MAESWVYDECNRTSRYILMGRYMRYVFRTQDSEFFLFNMKYMMKFYRPLYVSIKITKMRHKLVDCQNKHKYSTSMFGDLH